MKITSKWLKSHKWMLRSSDNGVSYNDYRWPAIGKWAKAPDWNPEPVCGGGFHGLTPEYNRAGLFYGRVELCEYRGEAVVVEGDKIKVRQARIVAINNDIPVEAFEACGFRLATDGQVITEGRWLVLGVAVTLNGGECYALNGATVTQNGGCCYANSGAVVIDKRREE